jgi:hypothetical protein
VLLLLGRKQHSYAQGHMLCLNYTLCLMQLSIVHNLILLGVQIDIPGGGLLVIDAVGWRSMYFVVMPRVNLVVIFLTYHVIFILSIAQLQFVYPACYFIYGETPLVNYGPRSYLHHIAITYLLYSYCLLYSHTILFCTRYAHNLCFKQTGEIDNLITSWEQSICLCVCRFHVATKHHLQSSLSLLS